MGYFSYASTSTAQAAHSDVRYLLPGGKIGLVDRITYLRTLVGAGVWFGWPPLLALLLARVGDMRSVYRLQRWWARKMRQHLDIRLDVAGLEHIEPGETYIITPLHEGFVDTMILWHLPLNMRFVARDELFTWRLLGPYLRITGHIEVCPERGSWSYRQLLRSARAVMQSGDSLAIFPQGGLLGIEIACMSGAFALARFLKRPVLPVALTGTHRVWEYPYSPRLRYGERVSMRVLEPVSVDDMLSREVDEVCQDVCQRLKQTALSGTMAPPRRFVPSRDGYWDGYAYCIDPMFPDLAADIEHHRHVTETRSLLRAQPDQ